MTKKDNRRHYKAYFNNQYNDAITISLDTKDIDVDLVKGVLVYYWNDCSSMAGDSG